LAAAGGREGIRGTRTRIKTTTNVKSHRKNAVVPAEVAEVVVAEIVAVDGCGVLEGGVTDVDVAVFDKTGKGSFVHLAPVLV
jgi:hypothetical protein